MATVEEIKRIKGLDIADLAKNAIIAAREQPEASVSEKEIER